MTNVNNTPTMNGKYIRNYRNEKGTLVFVYELTGKPADLERYKTIQEAGDHYRVDETTKKPLFFSVNFAGDDAKIIITPKDKVFVDLSEYQKAASLVAQFGGNFGQAMAEEAVRRIMGGKTQVQQPAQMVPGMTPEDI